jgi:hypothetical protein
MDGISDLYSFKTKKDEKITIMVNGQPVEYGEPLFLIG